MITTPRKRAILKISNHRLRWLFNCSLLSMIKCSYRPLLARQTFSSEFFKWPDSFPLGGIIAPMNVATKMRGFKSSRAFPYLLDALFFVLCFGITFLCYVLLFHSLGFYPFNEEGLTTMMLDQRDQYIAYMRAYQNVLKSGGSIVYTLGKVFGGDFQSIFTYYLSSPFNLLLVFFSSADIPAFFFFTSIVKMSFAAANVYLLARFMFKRRRVGYLCFGVAYGLISYALVYFSNFMYLDGLMVLPLVTLGLEALKRGRGMWVYPLSLAYALFSNWYIGFMTCVYCLLFYVVTVIFMKGRLKERLQYSLRFFLFSLVGGLLSALIWVNAYCHFDGTKATRKLPASSFFNWASFFEGLLENNYLSRSAISRNTGYMTMFVSVVSLAFSQLYLTNKSYSWREKCRDGSVLTLFFLASLYSLTNALLHGGREPTWFPTRYSFIIGFFLCYLSLKEMDQVEKTPLWGAGVPTLSALILLPVLCSLWKNALARSGEQIYYPLSLVSLLLYILTLVFTEAYLLLLKAKAKDIPSSSWVGKTKYILEGALLCLTLVSSCRSSLNTIQANIDDSSYLAYSTYQKDEDLSKVFDAVKEFDPSLYRMESTFNRYGSNNTIDNNPLFYSYNGLSHYSSLEKSEVSSYMKRLGFHVNGFWERYDAGSTEAMNAFLGVKYLIDQNDFSYEKPQFLYTSSALNLFKKEEIAPYEGYAYYKNELALPLGFVTCSSNSTFVSQGEKRGEGTYWYDHFEYQNRMYKKLSDRVLDEEGRQKDIFRKIDCGEPSLSSGVTLKKTDEYGRSTYAFAANGSLTYSFTIPEEASNNTLYICVKSPSGDFTYRLDSHLLRLGTYWDSGIHSFNAKKGSTHTFKISLSSGKSARECEIVPEIYYEDLSVLREYLEDVSKQGAKNLKAKSTLFSTSWEGNFTLDRDEGEFLFTLPYEKNFSVYLDGKKRKTLTRFDIFTAISLDEVGKGEHNIKIVYLDKGMALGGACSVISVGGFVPLMIFYPRLERKLFKRKDETDILR